MSLTWSRSWRAAALCGVLLAGTSTAAEIPDLTGFRTVETAQTARIESAANVGGGRAGYLGVVVEPDSRGRLAVTELETDSPAAHSGFQLGDVIDRVSGKALRSAEELRQLLQSRAPGESLTFRVQRKKKKTDLTAVLGATSRPLQISERRAILGVTIGEPDEGGAPIRQVTTGSPAEAGGLKVGDVLLKVDGAPLPVAASLSDSLAEKKPGDTVRLAIRREGKDSEIQVTLGEDRRNSGERESRGTWKKDVYRLAIIGVEYPDVKHNAKITAADWEESLFSKGVYAGKTSVTGQTVYGSMNDYYQELSCGVFRVEGKVFDWLEVSKKRAEYSQGAGAGNRTALLTEALDLLLARDGANALDGFDGVYFLYAGSRFVTNRGGLYWPHRANVTHRGKLWPYFIMQEGGERMSDISTMCHEFGHMLGLPDLYARPENPGSEGLGAWCAMSNQAPNGRPQHMGAWCKEQLGWLKPAVIDPTVRQKLVLSPIVGSQKECFKVLIRQDGSEYLLLENRRRTRFDTSLPAEGLLIWHIVGNRPILEESHGINGPDGPRVFQSVVPYPSKANSAYTPYTTPSSRSQLGGGFPVYITNIRQLADGRVTFYVGYDFQ